MVHTGTGSVPSRAGIGKLRPTNKFIVALERPHFKCIKRKIANKLITIQVCVHAG